MQKLRVLLIAALVSFVGAVSADHKSEHAVEERTAPTGKIYRAGDDVPVAAPVVVAAAGPRDGETVYTQKCAACHSTGIANAPKAGDAGAWSARITKGAETLVTNAINGIQDVGIMPAKGGCTDCSDDEIKAAVDHMLAMIE